MHNLGGLLSEPRNPEHNLSEAAALFEALSLSGTGDNHQALYRYGRALWYGFGVERDRKRGLDLLRQAVGSGKSRAALLEMATLFENGDGTSDNSFIPKSPALGYYQAVLTCPASFPEFFDGHTVRRLARNTEQEWHLSEDHLGQKFDTLLSWELAGQAFLFSAVAALASPPQPEHFASLLAVIPVLGINLAGFSICSSLKTAIRNGRRRATKDPIDIAKLEACKAVLGIDSEPAKFENERELFGWLAGFIEWFAVWVAVIFWGSWMVLFVNESLSFSRGCSDWLRGTCLDNEVYCDWKGETDMCVIPSG